MIQNGHETVYQACLIKRRRSTQGELASLRNTMVKLLSEDNPMTVRQVFYQMTVCGAVEKTDPGYELVQRELLKMRRGKTPETIPYSWIADNTRWMRKPWSFSCPQDALSRMAGTYRRALWDDQAVYVEIWCEKDALAGVILEETRLWDVPLMVSRGFSSDSYLYECAEAIKAAGKPAYLYYFGDRDPSGMKIDRAIRSGLGRLAPGADITFVRAAVTLEQIEALGLPTRPTKREGNAHAKDFDGESVELDAMPSATLRCLVRECIERHIDPDVLRRTRLAEAVEKDSLRRVAENFRL
jgi:hypothetical protein